jgi:hypothetical protein
METHFQGIFQQTGGLPPSAFDLDFGALPFVCNSDHDALPLATVSSQDTIPESCLFCRVPHEDCDCLTQTFHPSTGPDYSDHDKSLVHKTQKFNSLAGLAADCGTNQSTGYVLQPSQLSDISSYLEGQEAPVEESTTWETKNLDLKRFYISKDSKVLLEEAFRMQPYPENNQFESLAHRTYLTIKQVKTWFTNTRTRRLKKRRPRLNPLL